MRTWRVSSACRHPTPVTWAKATLDATRYTGVMTQPVLLASLAHSIESSYVFRGRTLRKRVLCTPLGSPPANAMAEFAKITLPKNPTGKEVSASVQARGSCAGCHSLMDPMGLAFEHFDALGHFRDKYGSGRDIDPSGSVLMDSGDTITFADQSELMEEVSTTWQRKAVSRGSVPLHHVAPGNGRRRMCFATDRGRACFVEWRCRSRPRSSHGHGCISLPDGPMSNRIDRRCFLVGAGGAMLAIPMLEAFAPRRARGQQVAPPKRLVIVTHDNGRMVGNGAPDDWWSPRKTTGALPATGAISQMLAELGDVRNEIVTIDGIDNIVRHVAKDMSCGHTDADLTVLTCKVAAAVGQAGGPSLDYVAGLRLRANDRCSRRSFFRRARLRRDSSTRSRCVLVQMAAIPPCSAVTRRSPSVRFSALPSLRR